MTEEKLETSGALTLGTFMCTPDEAVKAACLMSLAAHAIDQGAWPGEVGEILADYATCKISFDEADRELIQGMSR